MVELFDRRAGPAGGRRFLETRNVQLGTQLSQGNFKPIVISHLIASACIVLYCWLVIFGFIGVFRQFFSGENKTIRYLSDSSYWLYVAHMPLMMFLQGLVAPWAMPSLVKFLLVCGVTVGLLLLMYEYVIRYTFVGTLLNGKRTREPAASRLLASPESTRHPAACIVYFTFWP